MNDRRLYDERPRDGERLEDIKRDVGHCIAIRRQRLTAMLNAADREVRTISEHVEKLA